MIETALSDRATRVMLLIIALVLGIAGLQAAQSILAPFVFALVLGIVVSPVSERAASLGVPRVVTAILLLVFTTIAVVALFVIFEPMVSQMIERLPRLKFAIQGWIATASDMMRGIETISDEIEQAVGANGDAPTANVPSLRDALWLAPNFGAQVFIFIGTFFFFLLTRDTLYSAAGPLQKKLYKADALVSRYFAAVTMVNAGVGAATGAVLMALGVDHPLLWGLFAGTMNYILYLGPIVVVSGLLIAGLAQFWGAMAFLPPAAFLVINMIEAQFVTPLFVGQHVKLNPLVVFLAVVFGLWLWGPIGAIVALPVILWLGLLLRPQYVAPDASASTFLAR